MFIVNRPSKSGDRRHVLPVSVRATCTDHEAYRVDRGSCREGGRVIAHYVIS